MVGEALDGLEALQKAKDPQPDLIILDIGLPILNGIESAKRIRQVSPSSRVIFATQTDDADIRIEALATGAKGYVLKANAARELLPAVEAALKSGQFADARFAH